MTPARTVRYGTRWVAPRLAWLVFAAAWGYLGWRIVSDASNHVGFHPMWIAVAFVPLFCLGAIRLRGAKRSGAVAMIAAAVLGTAALWLVERANVLVDYEVWLQRGMPGRPF